MSSWQKVYQDPQQYRAEIVKAVLEDNDISAVVLSKKDPSYHFGHFEVQVVSDDVIKAIKIIQDDISFK